MYPQKFFPRMKAICSDFVAIDELDYKSFFFIELDIEWIFEA
jgi:hypothetical protein